MPVDPLRIIESGATPIRDELLERNDSGVGVVGSEVSNCGRISGVAGSETDARLSVGESG